MHIVIIKTQQRNKTSRRIKYNRSTKESRDIDPNKGTNRVEE